MEPHQALQTLNCPPLVVHELMLCHGSPAATGRKRVSEEPSTASSEPQFRTWHPSVLGAAEEGVGGVCG